MGKRLLLETHCRQEMSMFTRLCELLVFDLQYALRDSIISMDVIIWPKHSLNGIER